MGVKLNEAFLLFAKYRGGDQDYKNIAGVTINTLQVSAQKRN